MLERIKIRNFKSFAEAELRLRPLTVMIGANASGKTNFIEAIGLLAWMARGERLTQIHNAIRDGELQLRGAPQRLTLHGNEQPIAFEVDVGPMRLELDVALNSPTPRVERERLQHTSPVSRVVFEFPSYPSTIANDRPMFPHDLTDGLGDDELSSLAFELERISVFRPNPGVMRGYANYNDWDQLRWDGANISAVVDNLCQSGYRERILEFVRTLPEQDIRAIDFIRVPDRYDIMLKVLESFGDREQWQEAAVLSDGTLRTLAIAAAVFNASSLLIIEDIDDGVHPSRLASMVELLRRFADEQDIKILVTTHNPALLDALPDEELAHVVACYRDPEQGDSRLIELGDLHDFSALVAQGSLGQLVTEGILDRALKHDRTPQQRAAEALEWLAELEAGE